MVYNVSYLRLVKIKTSTNVGLDWLGSNIVHKKDYTFRNFFNSGRLISYCRQSQYRCSRSLVKHDSNWSEFSAWCKILLLLVEYRQIRPQLFKNSMSTHSVFELYLPSIWIKNYAKMIKKLWPPSKENVCSYALCGITSLGYHCIQKPLFSLDHRNTINLHFKGGAY